MLDMPVALAPLVPFQSAPGQLAGRCPRHNITTNSGHHVSIRARPIGRAMRQTNRPPILKKAVSIRARPIGRAMRYTRRSISHCSGCFNPRPANWPGDARPSRTHALVLFDVSIRARPIGRAMPRNPAAPVRRLPVSIRARPIGRAMLARNVLYRALAAVSIRARPIGRAMHLVFECTNGAQMFQSAPGQLAGRCAEC